MAHKHNRRRVRRSRNATFENLTQRHSFDQSILSQRAVLTAGLWSSDQPTPANLTSLSSYPMPPSNNYRRPDIPARLWQNRFAAWQDRDRAQKEHAAKLEAQQIQLFGGEPGDDVELCYRMLEYFGGLDYIK